MTLRYFILLVSCGLAVWVIAHLIVGWKGSWPIPLVAGVVGALIARTIRRLYPEWLQ